MAGWRRCERKEQLKQLRVCDAIEDRVGQRRKKKCNWNVGQARETGLRGLTRPARMRKFLFGNNLTALGNLSSHKGLLIESAALKKQIPAIDLIRRFAPTRNASKRACCGRGLMSGRGGTSFSRNALEIEFRVGMRECCDVGRKFGRFNGVKRQKGHYHDDWRIMPYWRSLPRVKFMILRDRKFDNSNI